MNHSDNLRFIAGYMFGDPGMVRDLFAAADLLDALDAFVTAEHPGKAADEGWNDALYSVWKMLHPEVQP
jgi:hypothetical protein